jgi:NADH dehydrogenase
MRYDVVIAGGGFAGAYCARALGRALGREEGVRRVALVAERNVLTFQPMLAEVAGSSLAPLDVVNPLRQFCREVNVLQGAVQHVDWAARELVLDGGRFTRNHVVGFTHLALLLGSVTDLTPVPGMAEYGWPMKSVADALRLRAALINRLEEANLIEDPEARARLLTFVVVGGGYTGVETAGQVFDLIRQARRFYANLRGTRLRVVLVHAHDRLLPDIGASLGAYARDSLVRRGVEVRLGTKVAAVTARRVLFSDGSELAANTVITTIGSAPNPVVVDLCRELGIETVKGRVPVDATLRVPGQEFLWSAGDCAAVPWTDRGVARMSPPTAQFAMRQGRRLGANLAAVLRGRRPAPFRYRYMGQLASIGEHSAVAEIFGFHFRGFAAWWLWRTIYLAKLPGVLRRLRVMIDWTFDLVFPRDISLLVPPPDDVLRAIHLEKGERLYGIGEPCRAFFYVRRGALTLSCPSRPDEAFPAGSVIDQGELAPDGCWLRTAAAADRTDIVVFRGRALELLRNELKLVRRE